MYEELIKRLKDYSTARKGEIAELTEEAADAIEELEKKMLNLQATADDHWEAYQHWFHKYMDDMPVWIPATERLPKSETEVLITDGKHVNKAYFCEHDGRCSFTFIDSGRNPNGYDEGATHWMPLPELPKEEQT